MLLRTGFYSVLIREPCVKLGKSLKLTGKKATISSFAL